MVDQILLNDTLSKINASLNKRFEKDANLYISRQDEYELKKNFCNGAYGGVVDMAKAKGLSHDIVVKVMLRNAGLINVDNIARFKKELQPVLLDADYSKLSYMMEDVLGNNVYMQKQVRHVMFVYYMNGITSVKRLNYWKRGDLTFDSYERRTLYYLILSKTRHRDASKTLQYKIDFMNEAFELYPDLMNEKDAMLRLKDSLDENDKLRYFKHLCREMQDPSIDNDAYDFILVDTYASYGEQAFKDAVDQIKASSPHYYKQYIKVINKLFWTEKDKDTVVRMFDTIVRVYESAYIKNHIKREISKKVWKAAKKNEILYQERKRKIDVLLSEVETTETDKYTSYDDVAKALDEGTNQKSIAYFWVNMRSPDFEESIIDSLEDSDGYRSEALEEVYTWLFDHSVRKGGPQELNRMCERIATALYRFAKEGGQSECYDFLDDCWLERVIQYKLKGKNIKDYMFAVHYESVRNKSWNE